MELALEPKLERHSGLPQVHKAPPFAGAFSTRALGFGSLVHWGTEALKHWGTGRWFTWALGHEAIATYYMRGLINNGYVVYYV